MISLPEEEVRIVSSRIRDCLTATNMSDYFIANNYMTTAEHNTRQVLDITQDYSHV